MMLVTLPMSPVLGALLLSHVGEGPGDLGRPRGREGISLEPLQSSSSMEILYSNYSYGKKNAVGLRGTDVEDRP